MSVENSRQVALAVGGDRDALGALLEEFGPEVEAKLVISPKWRGQLDAADVMQVTYLEAFAHIGGFDAERANSFAAWLARIAENNLRDAVRALEAGKNPPPELKLDAHGADHGLALFDVLTSGGETPSRISRQEEAKQRLLEALASLPTDYAETVRLYDLEGHPIEEVANRLGRSVGAVYMLRMRAHDRLRHMLGRASEFIESRS